MTLFFDVKLYFQHHSSSLQCHMIFTNEFAAQETFLIIIKLYFYFVENSDDHFSQLQLLSKTKIKTIYLFVH